MKRKIARWKGKPKGVHQPVRESGQETTTRVVNIKDSAHYDVYCGRPGPLGNPFQSGTRDTNCDNFEAMFKYRIETDSKYRKAVLACRGKTLGCYCKPLRCHADTIAKWVDSQATREDFTATDKAWAIAARAGIGWLEGVPVAFRASRNAHEHTKRAVLLGSGRANRAAYIDLYEQHSSRP